MEPLRRKILSRSCSRRWRVFFEFIHFFCDEGKKSDYIFLLKSILRKYFFCIFFWLEILWSGGISEKNGFSLGHVNLWCYDVAFTWTCFVVGDTGVTRFLSVFLRQKTSSGQPSAYEWQRCPKCVAGNVAGKENLALFWGLLSTWFEIPLRQTCDIETQVCSACATSQEALELLKRTLVGSGWKTRSFFFAKDHEWHGWHANSTTGRASWQRCFFRVKTMVFSR